ncbi:MAG: hypothetical protein AAF821_20615 [Cyanobacteria bacterium P01_D01_bin.156]
MKSQYFIRKIFAFLFQKSISRRLFRNTINRVQKSSVKQQTNTFSTKEKSASEILILFVFLLLVGCVVSFQIGHAVAQGKTLKGWQIIGSLVAALPLFDLIRGFIEGSIDGVIETEKFREKNITSLVTRDDHDQVSDTNYRRKRHYISCIISDNKSFGMKNLKISEVNKGILQDRDRKSDEELSSDLSELFEGEKKRRRVVCSIVQLPDQDFLFNVAAKVSVEILGKTQKEISKSPTDHRFFEDIYIYLKAWLKCSVDSNESYILDNDADNFTVMPISYIGINYPTTNKPDKYLYIKAINYMINEIFTEDISGKLFPDVEEYVASPEVRNYIKKYLKKLRSEIDRY